MTEIKVRQQYDQIAEIYDQRWSGYITNTLSFLKDWAQIPPTANVLDVACGTGELERLLLREYPQQQIMGVDISEKMLLVAQQKCRTYPHVEFHVTSVNSLPFASSSFDVVISANAFHYFDEPLLALIEIKRVLKPDGKVVILDWCRDYLLCKICDFILKVFDAAHNQCYTQTEFHHWLESANFNIRRATRVRFGLVWGLMVSEATEEVFMENVKKINDELTEKMGCSL